MFKAIVLIAAILLAAAAPNANGYGQIWSTPIAPLQSTLVVHPSQTYAPAPANPVGGDMLTGSADITKPGTSSALNQIGFNSYRDPQGTVGNCYSWSTNSCGSCPVSQNANSTLAAFVALLGPRVGHLIANEASDPTCTTGNTTTDVAGMVNYVRNTLGCTTCTVWTIDNEMYNSNANLPFTPPSCPTDTTRAACYKARFATFSAAMLAQDSGITTCLDADPQQSGPQGATWDTVVMAQVFKCGDGHYYQTTPGNESDVTALLAPHNDFTANFVPQFKADIAASSSPNAIMVLGEYGILPSSYGVQQQGPVQAAFNAEMIGECAQDGFTLCEFHAAVANCQAVIVRSGLYGQWLTFTGSMSLSNGDLHGTCNGVSGLPPAGTVLAPGDGLEVASYFTRAGETIIKSTLTGTNGDVTAYSSTYGSGVSELIVNRSFTATYSVVVSIDGHSSGAGGTIVQYSKAIFDLTNSVTPAWNSPTFSTLAPWTTSFTVNVPPLSETSVKSG